MKRIAFIVAAAFCILPLALRAYDQSFDVIRPLKVEVPFSKTLHIIFPSPVRYVDLGSTDIIAAKADGSENVLRIKASAKDFEAETNFSVITSDGSFYTFDAIYNDSPLTLNMVIQNPSTENSVLLNELGEISPYMVEKTLQQIYSEDRSDTKSIGCTKNGIKTLLKGLYIRENMLYLHIGVFNNSRVPFDIDRITYRVVDKKVLKRTPIQENDVTPTNTFNEIKVVGHLSNERMVTSFHKFTIPDDKIFIVDIYEKNGGRHQQFRIENRDILNAIPL
ncbi:MAG: conjugative transposon protein TraN [Alistipes sp.]|nr:conjugative transposon protein TraN [Alistipes sp.]